MYFSGEPSFQISYGYSSQRGAINKLRITQLYINTYEMFLLIQSFQHLYFRFLLMNAVQLTIRDGITSPRLIHSRLVMLLRLTSRFTLKLVKERLKNYLIKHADRFRLKRYWTQMHTSSNVIMNLNLLLENTRAPNFISHLQVYFPTNPWTLWMSATLIFHMRQSYPL